MAFIWNIGIAPGNVKPRTGQVIRRTASLRNKSDDVEAEKGLSKMRAILSKKKIDTKLGDTLWYVQSVWHLADSPFHALDLG
jgi:hypothetical protein